MMRLFLETYPEDSKDDETVTLRTARMMRLFHETYPEDSKDDETVPEDSEEAEEVKEEC
jgi:hypothetical protein